MDDMKKYGLDIHCTMIMEEYQEMLPIFRKLRDVVKTELKKMVDDAGIYVTAMETRIKAEESLAGKLELKGAKYQSISDITDILGARIITFYSEDVDAISLLVDKTFEIDWKNSVDKRKMHELDSFGYNSLHFICRIPKELYFDPEHPEINTIRFELQMRTALQHVWATINHDTGYKVDWEIPTRYLRNMNRIAGMLELADEQFSIIRSEINDYCRKLDNLVKEGLYAEAPLTVDTFRRYLEMNPFRPLMKRIANVIQAEIHEDTLIPYVPVMKKLGFKTINDVETIRKKYSEDAYQLASIQLAGRDLDILSSTIALFSILVVYVLSNGGREKELTDMMDSLYGPSDYNATRAGRLIKAASSLEFMNK